ncbi:hypothetical protein SKAU_G00155080 [Synaphobranchus kaupii]|uniref:Uncharacterized protein n=1 Tax=Synaphobranchus kaupii TaxID=118154 RepID=A0A9Q1IYU1_SYNKA|nr:hypothetical protein SKAU_G00155080 [Synaphobranchus kaupii]
MGIVRRPAEQGQPAERPGTGLTAAPFPPPYAQLSFVARACVSTNQRAEGRGIAGRGAGRDGALRWPAASSLAVSLPVPQGPAPLSSAWRERGGGDWLGLRPRRLPRRVQGSRERINSPYLRAAYAARSTAPWEMVLKQSPLSKSAGGRGRRDVITREKAQEPRPLSITARPQACILSHNC